jgi:hypothetical protein
VQGRRIGDAMVAQPCRLDASIEARAGNTKGMVFNFNASSFSVNDQGGLMVGKSPWGLTGVARTVQAHVKASSR